MKQRSACAASGEHEAGELRQALVGGAGRFRGGSGTKWEVEPLDKPMTLITFGEGRRIPAMGAAGAGYCIPR